MPKNNKSSAKKRPSRAKPVTKPLAKTRAKNKNRPVKPLPQKIPVPEEIPELEDLFDSVSAQITPSAKEAEAEKKFALQLVSQLGRELSGEKVRVFFVGSAARDTGLKGDRDIDLFVSFPATHERDYIAQKTFAAVRSHIPGHWEMHYAEHPYLQARLGDYQVEVIPCFQIEPHQQIKSAVDRSPLHMDYLQKRLNPKQKRDVRVLKQLLKRAEIYGAESRVGGFSGLVCEYLVLNFRSLHGLLTAASNWVPPTVIDIEGTRSNEKLSEKYDSPLVIIDAIDRRRNAAASVTLHSLAAFISLSQALLANPSQEFFFAPPAPAFDSKKLEKLIRERGTFSCAIEFPAPNVVEDILFPQVRKTQQSIEALLQREGFTLLDSTDFLAAGKVYMVFDFTSPTRPPIRSFSGPPAWSQKDVRNFAQAHPKPLRGPFIKGGKLVVEEKRPLVKADEFLRELVKARGWHAASVGSKIAPAFARARVVSGSELAYLPAEACAEVKKFLEKKEFWL